MTPPSPDTTPPEINGSRRRPWAGLPAWRIALGVVLTLMAAALGLALADLPMVDLFVAGPLAIAGLFLLRILELADPDDPFIID